MYYANIAVFHLCNCTEASQGVGWIFEDIYGAKARYERMNVYLIADSSGIWFFKGIH